jgi:hypothetical protein
MWQPVGCFFVMEVVGLPMGQALCVVHPKMCGFPYAQSEEIGGNS